MAFHKASGAVFAIKKVKKEIIKANKLIDQFILEVKLQSYLTHPFILKIYGIFDDETYIYLVLEFMEQGTLFNYLKKFKKLSEQDTAEKIRYLAESIQYLQDRGIAHRDIKP
jgi:serine/threonine protein kinase